MSQPHDRLILAAHAAGLPSGLSTPGFHRLPPGEILDVLCKAGLWVGPRQTLETCEDFRQIIPYIVVTDGARIVCYERTPVGGEARLHGKLSIGLGGHIDFSDVARHNDAIDLDGTMALSAQRELEEELGHISGVDTDWIGLIVENDTPVSRVHIGVVAVARLEAKAISAAEEAIANVRLLTPEELEREAARLEGWSQRLLPHLDLFATCMARTKRRNVA